MLHEIDTALRGLLTDGMPEGTPIRFDAPDRTWRAGDVRALDVFLYGVREDVSGRTAMWTEQRDPDTGRLTGRQPPLRRYYVNYLLTGWGEDTEDEHRLLGMAMAALAPLDVVPVDYLVGSLRAAELPVGIAVAHPELGGRPGDLWPSLGIAPRAALDVVVSATLVPALVTNLAEPARRVEVGMGNKVPTPPAAKRPPGKPDKWPESAITERS